MIDLIWARSGRWSGIVRNFASFDAGFGDDENDFSVELPTDVCEVRVGDEMFYPFTEYGGVVDSVEIDTTGDYNKVTLSGRTWHGIMDSSIVRPDPGQDYLTVSGGVEESIASLIARQGLDGTFVAAPGDEAAISYRAGRYDSMWSVLRGMLGSVGMVPVIRRTQTSCEVSAAPIRDISGVDDNYVPIKLVKSRPVNHLVCLGEGELSDRTVVDLYVGPDGSVSQTQSYFGADEIAEVYDYTSASRGDLIEDGTERLLGYVEDSSSIDAEIPADSGARVGDTVTGRFVDTGASVTASVSIISVSGSYGRDPDVTYKVGSTRFKLGD